MPVFPRLAFRHTQKSELYHALCNMRQGERTVLGTCVACSSPVYTHRLSRHRARWYCWNGKCRNHEARTMATKYEPSWFRRDDGVAERFQEPLPEIQ